MKVDLQFKASPTLLSSYKRSLHALVFSLQYLVVVVVVSTDIMSCWSFFQVLFGGEVTYIRRIMGVDPLTFLQGEPFLVLEEFSRAIPPALEATLRTWFQGQTSYFLFNPSFLGLTMLLDRHQRFLLLTSEEAEPLNSYIAMENELFEQETVIIDSAYDSEWVDISDDEQQDNNDGGADNNVDDDIGNDDDEHDDANDGVIAVVAAAFFDQHGDSNNGAGAA